MQKSFRGVLYNKLKTQPLLDSIQFGGTDRWRCVKFHHPRTVRREKKGGNAHFRAAGTAIIVMFRVFLGWFAGIGRPRPPRLARAVPATPGTGFKMFCQWNTCILCSRYEKREALIYRFSGKVLFPKFFVKHSGSGSRQIYISDDRRICFGEYRLPDSLSIFIAALCKLLEARGWSLSVNQPEKAERGH